jgi:hypothetical protein
MAPNPPDLSDSFFEQWVAMCGRLDVDPLDPLRVAYSESDCSARAHNPGGDAVGLIQFMPATLVNLGWHQGWAAFAALSAEQQVPFVEAYFKSHAHGHDGSPLLLSDAHCYVVTFLPACLPSVVAAGDAADHVVLCAKAGPLAWAYRDNPGLDADGDGRITVGDLRTHLAKVCRGARYDAIAARLAAIVAPSPDDVPTEPDPPIVHPDVPTEPDEG